MLSMNRMRCGWFCMITELVRLPSPKKRTPFISVPSVTPVAAKMMFFPGARSFERYTFLKSVMPIARQRSSCSGLLTTSRAKISPFRHRIAAAVRTPSGAPPVPITACTPDPTTAAARPAPRGAAPRRQVTIADQADARAGRADVVDQLLVPLALEHDHHQILDV